MVLVQLPGNSSAEMRIKIPELTLVIFVIFPVTVIEPTAEFVCSDKIANSITNMFNSFCPLNAQIKKNVLLVYSFIAWLTHSL